MISLILQFAVSSHQCKDNSSKERGALACVTSLSSRGAIMAESVAVSAFHLEKIRANGITHRVATVKGHHPADNDKRDPLIVLLHGWPEGWFSWRHQLEALANSGFSVCAPDLRGFGGTDAPLRMEDYRIDILCRDVISIVREFGFQTLVAVGHDFGAYVAWHTAVLYPMETVGVCGMALPFMGHSPSKEGLLTRLVKSYGNSLPQAPFLATREEQEKAKFHYILYHNLPNADEQYDLNVREALYRIYFYRPGVDSVQPEIRSNLMFPSLPRCETDTVDARSSPGLWTRTPRPKSFPEWMSKEDFDHMIGQYQTSGFRGGLNLYKVMNDNWTYLRGRFPEKMTVQQPSLFICGEEDSVVLKLYGGLENIRKGLQRNCERLTKIVVLSDSGHFCQQERPGRVNQELFEFISTVLIYRKSAL